MKEFIKKLIERLEESKERYDDVAFFEMNTNGHTLDFEYSHGKEDGVSEAIGIANQLAEEFATDTNVGSSGWIPCRERLPEEQKTKDGHIDPSEEVLVYIYYGENCVNNGYAVSRFWRHSKHHPNPWIDLRFGMENVIAWKPIAPYQPKGE